MITEQQAYVKLSALCARAEHCCQEMRDKMNRWEMEPEVQEAVIARLVKEKFIDEERYCRFFVHDKIAFSRWGRRKIEQALAMKRIPSDVYKPALDAVDPEDYLQALRPLIKSKMRTTKAASAYELACKLMRYAAGRGFSIEEVKQVIDEAGAEADEDDF